ncbi:hypothetical protein KV112_20550 [Mycolicibacter sp. MYC123]|uniref:Uncharacterized protein n=1 Tax=[Mycobacterium] zoologicum TaxID=2872311 RepID=A0ABU5YQU3_9MYCO|nr:hypothetical protein [Mycolicibacter sp. MYC123]MEB3052105.1 hypothetical protein [Mycolicibacter sp. MYC123]
MSGVLDRVSRSAREIITQELGLANPALLKELSDVEVPTNTQRKEVERVLAAALMNTLGPDWVPSERGRAMERAVEAFLQAWPIKR